MLVFPLLTSSLMPRNFPTATLQAIVPASKSVGLNTTGTAEGTSNLNSVLNLSIRGSMRQNMAMAVIRQQNSQEVTSISLPNIKITEAIKPYCGKRNLRNDHIYIYIYIYK